jgi:N utilization substance protein B
MASRHEIRRLAMQALYQFDLRGHDDAQHVRQCLEDAGQAPEACGEAFELAQAAWSQHEQADAAVGELAPDWPTHRQPPLDRAILRLAYHEIASKHAPARVVINEAIVLAKEYCSEQSPGFINGVLDKIARRIGAPLTPAESPNNTPTPP